MGHGKAKARPIYGVLVSGASFTAPRAGALRRRKLARKASARRCSLVFAGFLFDLPESLTIKKHPYAEGMKLHPLSRPATGLYAQPNRRLSMRCDAFGRSSSVVERVIGNDEVGSSILPCGTSLSLSYRDGKPRYLRTGFLVLSRRQASLFEDGFPCPIATASLAI